MITTILGIQVWVILPAGRHAGRYWPFVEYPMYSAAHHASESVTTLDLKLTACDPGVPGAGTDSLGIPLMRFQSLLRSAVSESASAATRDSSRTILDAAILNGTHRRKCTAEVVSQSVPLEAFDWRSQRRPATPLLKWNVAAATTP